MTEETGSDALLQEQIHSSGENVSLDEQAAKGEAVAAADQERLYSGEPEDDGDEADHSDEAPPADEEHPEFDELPPETDI